MGKKEDKTNVMRILDEKNIAYESASYEGGALAADEVAAILGQNPGAVFKTLVTVGKSGEYFVFMVPGSGELDLKKAAKAAGEKAVEMIQQKQLLPLTGYLHGGCSPIGMKKPLRTFIDASAEGYDRIYFSAGRVGRQVCLPLRDLRRVVDVTSADITRD